MLAPDQPPRSIEIIDFPLLVGGRHDPSSEQPTSHPFTVLYSRLVGRKISAHFAEQYVQTIGDEMTERYREIAFTAAVRDAQERNGSTEMYAGKPPSDGTPDELTEAEITFIAARDSFYMATISATDWPYMQHRGGPVGFVKILGAHTIGIADYRGNRQYLSVGNLADNDRAALFFMDYPNRRRLKVLAHARTVDLESEPELIAKLSDPGYRAKVERGLVFEIEAFDWNCPQHITQRLTAAEMRALSAAR